ncbi:hypothetical protein PJN93_30065, partial [Mycobacterium kansasii]
MGSVLPHRRWGCHVIGPSVEQAQVAGTSVTVAVFTGSAGRSSAEVVLVPEHHELCAVAELQLVQDPP